MKNLRKSLIIGVMALTVLGMGGFGTSANAAAPQAGDLIKMDGLSAVYFLGNDGKRYVYPHSSVFFTWHKDFSGVVTVSDSEMKNYPLGGNIAVRPGTKLIKITTDPSVYAVEANGTIRKIQSAADAIAIYGANWEKRMIDVSDAFFTNYTIGTPLASGSIAAGTLVKNASSAAIYLYDGTNYRSIATEAAFNANRYDFANVITISSAITAGGTAITTGEFSYDAQTKTSGPVITGSGLTASISAATPVSQNIPAGSSVEFLKVNLTAANDGAANVSSIKLTAYGLSDALYIDDVTFYDNGVKVGTSKPISSDRIATFNFSTPVQIAAGQTKSLTVKATIQSDKTGTFGLGIASASDIISSAASVSGSFPVKGNLLTAVEASIGTITVDSNATTGSASFGEDSVLLADFTLKAGNDEDALVQSIALYNGGTRNDEIVSNLKLVIDGEEVATGSYANDYATFALNNYLIEKGDTVNVEVRGDMGITGADDSVKLYLKNINDLVAVGKTQGFDLGVTNNFPSTKAITVTLSTGDITIAMDKTATPAKDIKADTQNVELATLTIKSNGENATITEITGTGTSTDAFNITSSTTTDAVLENAELVDANGGIYELTITRTGGRYDLALSDEISLVKGVAKTFKVRADILATASANDTFKVNFAGGSMTIEGDVSGDPITSITPSSVSGALMTVKDATLTVTPVVLTDINVVGSASDVVVYKAMVEAGTADSVKIQSLKLTASSSNSVIFDDSNITKFDLYLNGNLLKSVSNQINETAGTITFSSLNSANYTVAAGKEVELVVKATFASAVQAGAFELKIASNADLSARAVSDSATVTANADITTLSRLVSAVEAGTLNVALVTTDSKANKDSFLLAGSQTETGRYLGEIKFTTTNEAVKVKTLTLTGGGTATSQDIKEVKLVKADGTVVATKTVNAGADATFDPFDVVFSADQATSLFIVAVAKGMNIDGDSSATAESGKTLSYTLGTVTAAGNSSTEDIEVSKTGSGTSKVATVVGSKLNSVVNAMTDATLIGGVGKTIGKYTLTFDNGSNRDSLNEDLKAVLTKFAVTISTSSKIGLANINLNIDGTSDKATTTSFTAGVATWNNVNLAALTNAAKLDGAVTLVVTADITTSDDAGEYVQTSITDVNGPSDFINYSSNAIDHTSMYLPVTDVAGATLTE